MRQHADRTTPGLVMLLVLGLVGTIGTVTMHPQYSLATETSEAGIRLKPSDDPADARRDSSLDELSDQE